MKKKCIYIYIYIYRCCFLLIRNTVIMSVKQKEKTGFLHLSCFLFSLSTSHVLLSHPKNKRRREEIKSWSCSIHMRKDKVGAFVRSRAKRSSLIANGEEREKKGVMSYNRVGSLNANQACRNKKTSTFSTCSYSCSKDDLTASEDTLILCVSFNSFRQSGFFFLSQGRKKKKHFKTGLKVVEK